MKHHLPWLCLSLALAACSSVPSSNAGAATSPPVPDMSHANKDTTDAATLGQYHWQLKSATDSNGQRIDALFAQPDKPLQLDFNDGRLHITHTCNAMGGRYTLGNGQLKIDPMMHTMMACPDRGLMTMEAAVGQRLRNTLTLSLRTDGDAPQLQLVTASGDTLQFTGQPTAETRYGGKGQTEFLEVAAQTVPCNHPLIPDKSCLNVRERHYDASGLKTGTPGPWHPLNQDIEGYTHEAGVRNVLRVKRYTIENPPADAPASAYVLDMVVESETAKH